MFDDIFNTLVSRSGRDTVSETGAEAASAAMQPQKYTKPPADLSDQISAWLADTLSLAESFAVSPMVAELKALDARSSLPGFRLAFVGEFNRGKSTLINRILDRPLIPVRVLPTTDTITAIVGGSEEQMEVRFPDGRQEIRRLQEASWSDLIVNEHADKPQEIFPYIRLTLDNSWLQELDVEIIDTPGVGDLNDRRSALVSDVLSQSDAAVLVVSAVLPFSLTEATFLEQEVLGRHIPLVLVVISMLDTLSEDQQPIVLQAVRDRVAQVSPLISVLPAHPIEANVTKAEAIEAVRAQIKALVDKADRRAWRSLQVAAALTDHLSTLIEFGRTALAGEQMSAAKREEARRKIREEARSGELQWEGLSLELDRRRLHVDQELRRRLRETRDDLVKEVSFELSQAPDPKSWWERKFAVRLRSEFLALAQRLESFLIDSLARDVKWLQDEVKQIFSTRLSQDPISTAEPFEPVVNVREIDLADIQRQLLYVRIGSGAAMIAGYLLIGPIGGAISIATSIAGEYYFKGRVEEQRQQLNKEVERGIDQAMDEYTSLLSERLHNLYQQIAQNMKREQSVWEAAKEAAIKANGDAPGSKPWQQLIDEASALQHEILAALEK